MTGKVKCTCGWSWDKSDSSKKDMYVCHECGRDNINNMKDGGWLDNYGKEDNYNDYNVSAPEGFQGDGYSNVGRNSSPAWGGQFQGGGNISEYKEQDYLDRGWDILSNPLTSFGYVARNEEIPDYLDRGLQSGQIKRNELENTLDLVNPIYYLNSAGRGAKDLITGQGKDFIGEALNFIPALKRTQGLGRIAKNSNKLKTFINSLGDIDAFLHATTGKDLISEEEVQKKELEKIKKKQMGGSVYSVNYVPQAQNGKLTFLQPNSDKLPEGYIIPYDTPSSERAMSIGGEDEEPAYLIPSFKYGKPLADPIEEFKKTGEHLGGPFKTWQEADKWEQEVRHPAVEKKENIMFPQEQFAMGGSIPGAVGFSYARTQSPAPSNGKYAKKTMASAQNGKEMQYYQNGLDWQPKTISKDGAWLDNYEQEEIIKDDRGQWDHPGEITEIGSNQITMQGVPYDVLGISDTGDTKLMKPGKNYKFKGKKVTEYPMAKNGMRQEQKGLQNLDQLTNFTNYNTEQPGGWLDTL